MGEARFIFDPRAYPDCPGIYRMLSADSQTLYIGKAQNLGKRLAQYFQGRHDGRYQIDLLLPQVAQVEVIATASERDALVLENQLIKRYKPKYNIRLKDDKTYPYIRLSKDEFPRIEMSREREDSGYEYFGPFTAAGTASRLVEFISTHNGLRRCPGVPLKKLERACLYAQIGQCSAPCIGKVEVAAYSQEVEQARKILPANVAIQGNLPPTMLSDVSPGTVVRETKKLLEIMRDRPGYIFNLGHGVTPDAKLENIQALMDTIRSFR